MKKILIMCNADPNSNPRPNRMIHWLEGDYELTVVARNEFRMDGVKTYAYKPYSRLAGAVRKIGLFETFFLKINGDYAGALTRFILRLINLALGRYDAVNWLSLGNARALIHDLSGKQFDLIISHDLVLLPLAFQIKGDTTKIMLDAREYYPQNFNDQRYWRVTKKPVNQYLCQKYLNQCNKIITVSEGIAQKYAQEYHVQPEVIMSLPEPQDLQPSPLQPDRIQIIHHGNANASRKTELMIEMMDYVDERFTLDLMMVVMDTKYWNKIVSMVEKRGNVHIVPPVPMQEIVRTINQYDIGLFLVPPTNFNLRHTLPNKLFEFIQARLAVAIGPSIEMKKIVDAYDCGIVSNDFSPQVLANELNKMTREKIMYYKGRAHKASQELNADVNKRRIQRIVHELLGGELDTYHSSLT